LFFLAIISITLNAGRIKTKSMDNDEKRESELHELIKLFPNTPWLPPSTQKITLWTETGALSLATLSKK